jgi:hypothetical protein
MDQLPDKLETMEIFRWEPEYDMSTMKDPVRLFPNGGFTSLDPHVADPLYTPALKAALDLMDGDNFMGSGWRQYLLTAEEFWALSGKDNGDSVD